MHVRCPNKQNNLRRLVTLNFYEDKQLFLKPIFQQKNAPLQKLMTIGNFVPEKERKLLESPAYSPHLNPIESCRANWQQWLRKETVFGGKTTKKNGATKLTQISSETWRRTIQIVCLMLRKQIWTHQSFTFDWLEMVYRHSIIILCLTVFFRSTRRSVKPGKKSWIQSVVRILQAEIKFLQESCKLDLWTYANNLEQILHIFKRLWKKMQDFDFLNHQS